ncbi:Histone acetyltransferase [Mycena venus]|uniref:Endopeptidase S2P n=1 Tax=Mycena venus TaxID=2733690 RepID=A0A8H7DEX4_9AGAR|nr:Histone acetyltransferase [Mycena venus]
MQSDSRASPWGLGQSPNKLSPGQRDSCEWSESAVPKARVVKLVYFYDRRIRTLAELGDHVTVIAGLTHAMNLGLILLLVWTIIHGANYFLHRKRAQSLLPTSAANSFGRSRNYFWDSRTTQVILNKFHLRVQTSAWNSRHDILAKSVAQRPGARLRPALINFYNAGCAVGALGTTIALGLLVWNCTHALLPLIHGTLAPSSSGPLLRRGLEAVETTVAPRGIGITPIIPGWTVPLRHLPVILLAVFLSQIVHELGHAISAALDAVPIVSAGASFTIVIPAAFVSFPSTALEALEPFARSRIIAAGPFHNLMFWFLLVLVDRAGTGGFLTHAIYRDVSDVGRVVVGIDSDSDLRWHLPLGSLITKLDDTPLGSANDQWTRYLTSPHSPSSALGWCVDRAAYLAPQSCCEPHASSPFSCFAAVSSVEKGCLDAFPILTDMPEQRCASDTDCPDASKCVRPDESAQILRLTIHTEGHDRVILWSGPLIEIHEQVNNSRDWQIPSAFSILAAMDLRIDAAFLELLLHSYLKMATLSLYLFNLLPLPYLDGSQFVQALLEMVFQADTGSGFDEYDIEALEAASTANQGAQRRDQGRWKERLGRGIPIATTCLFVFAALVALTNIQ